MDQIIYVTPGSNSVDPLGATDPLLKISALEPCRKAQYNIKTLNTNGSSLYIHISLSWINLTKILPAKMHMLF